MNRGSNPLLIERAKMLGSARAFFAARGVLEVDCPNLHPYPSLDAHIDPICADGGYLHTSPEYRMKELLSEGIGDIYQMGHVYRGGEVGERHTPEFTLVEWYRIGIPFEAMVEETAAFIALFLGEKPLTLLTYRDAFLKYADLDPLLESDDEKLNEVLGLQVEPHLGQDNYTALIDYPPTQAALAKIEEGVAKRFEIYYQGVELANGYKELTDAQEQMGRFDAANEKRSLLGKNPLPIDHGFLDALKTLPLCCGVAVGFDRLMMLRHKCTNIRQIQAVKSF